MNQESRTSNSIKNMGITLALQFISYILMFASRTIFVHLLGNDYLSLNGLFSNIITFLSFTDLGIGSAIVYCMYKPIANNDKAKIRSLIAFFKKVYLIITAIVLLLGACIIPFLKYLVDLETVSGISENIYIIYYLFVVNTAFSYILTYKKSFLIACQKTYIVNIIFYTIHAVEMIIQIIILYFTHNYFIYLTIQLICTLLTNVVTGLFVDKKYSFLKTKKTEKLAIDEKKSIKENVSSMFLYKVGAVVLNGTDNIIISVVIKTAYVGLCSNYLLIINAISNTLMMCFNSIAASVGNLAVTESSDRQEHIFYLLDLLTFLLFGFCSICLGVMLNPFINYWLGEEYLLGQDIVISLVLAFYFTGINQAAYLFRTATGLFKQTKFAPLVGAIINIVLSVVLSKIIGLSGVFIATAVVRIICFTLVDSRLIFKHVFKSSSFKYYLMFCVRICICVGGYLLVNYIIKMFSILSVASLIGCTILCAFITMTLLLISNRKNPLFRELIKMIICTIRNKIQKQYYNKE